MNVDHIPQCAEQCIIHKKHAGTLLRLFTDDMPNVVIHGGAHVGKSTLVQCVLTSMYNDFDSIPMLQETVTVQTDTKTVSESVYVRRGKKTVELYANNLKRYQRHIITKLLKDIGHNYTVYMQHTIVVFYNADALNKQTQHTIKRYIETSYNCLRFIFITGAMSKMSDVLTSRCANFRVSMDQTEVLTYISHVNSSERLGHTVEELEEIARMKNMNNVHAALWRISMHAEFHKVIGQIVKYIVLYKTEIIPFIPKIRECIYILLGNLYTGANIMKNISELLSVKSPRCSSRIWIEAGRYEHMGVNCTKWAYVIEGFILCCAKLLE